MARTIGCVFVTGLFAGIAEADDTWVVHRACARSKFALHRRRDGCTLHPPPYTQLPACLPAHTHFPRYYINHSLLCEFPLESQSGVRATGSGHISRRSSTAPGIGATIL